MTNKANRKRIAKGTTLLTLAALIAKFLSAFYKIPFQNLVGDLGFYVFQQVYPLYGIAVTISLSGMPMFISKLVAEMDSNDDQLAMIYQIRRGLIVFGGLVFIGLQIGAPVIANEMLDIKLVPVIRSVSYLYLIVPFLATNRGYFQGRMDMQPTAYSQVAEQIMRVGIIVGVSIWAHLNHVDPYKMGTWATSSAVFAALFAWLVIIKLRPKRHHWQVYKHHQHFPNLKRQLLLQGGTLCLVASIMVLMQLVDSFSVVKSLVNANHSISAAQTMKGIYDRSQTLVQLGLVIATASTTAAFPGLVMAITHNQQRTFNNIATTMVRVNVSLSITLWFGLLAIIPELNELLFKTASLNGTLIMYCVSIILMTLILAYNTVLQSQGIYLPTAVAIIGGILTKEVLTRFFITHMGIIGASTATVLALLVIAVAMRLISRKELSNLLNSKQIFLVILAAIGMLIMVRLSIEVVMPILAILKPRIQILGALLIAVPIGAIGFMMLASWLKIFSKREWLSVPFMTKMLKIKEMMKHENR